MAIKLTQPQAQRLRRLLHMEYTLAELAEELACPRRVLDQAVAAGCPHRVEGDRVFLVGDAFAGWYQSLPATHIPLQDGEAYCMHCRAARSMVETTTAPNLPGVEMVSGKCAVCGRRVNRLREAQS